MKCPSHILLAITVFFASPALVCAVTTVTTGELVEHYRPIQQRVGSELRLRVNDDQSVHLDYRTIETDSDNKVIGPSARGFILEARSIDDPTRLKLAAHPYNWEGYPEKEKYPWTAEFHIFYVERGLWLVVSVWCGPDTDRKLVQEIIEATAKGAEGTRKFFEPRN